MYKIYIKNFGKIDLLELLLKYLKSFSSTTLSVDTLLPSGFPKLEGSLIVLKITHARFRSL